VTDRTDANLHGRKSWHLANPALKIFAAMIVLLLCGYGGANLDRHSAASLAKSMGRPEQLLIGLGSTDIADIKKQKIKVDILDRYLIGVGESSWANWNAPKGDYIRIFTEQADAVGAVPMFTLAQMNNKGEGWITDLTNHAFMQQYWDNVKLLFLKLGQYDSPALVNLEPDFWGHAQKKAMNGDPATLDALVSINPDCADLPNNLAGVADCYLRSADKYAPRAMLGFPLSDWAGRSPAEVAKFMTKLGADQADFMVLPSDRRVASASGLQAYLDKINFYHEAVGDLPVLLWRTSLGASADLAKGKNDEGGEGDAHFFLTQAEKLVAAGGLGVVFSAGETDRTDIATDDGRFRILSFQYLANPAPFL